MLEVNRCIECGMLMDSDYSLCEETGEVYEHFNCNYCGGVSVVIDEDIPF